MSELQEAVRSRYASAAQRFAVIQPASEAGACCGGDCGCGGAYSATELASSGLSEGVSLGCGNPTLLAQLEPGQAVLDLGSGAGLDVLLSARRVAPGGHAYGVDMTDEMVALANRNRDQAGIANATFLKGTIENVPLPDGVVDVVISNCVINLAEDKAAVIAEAFRVLKPGGLFAVADMVEVETLAPEIKRAVDSWAGCVSGTIPVEEYRALLLEAGFAGPEIEVHSTQTFPAGGSIGSAYVRARKPA
ncbi:MAG TPA: arsenite methyltransferase [Candidatus Dormibacteraeota bacterium]